MRRMLARLSRPALAFPLLVGAAAVIFGGAIVARLNEQELKKLNDMLLQDWLGLHAARPLLYLWIFILFIILTLLALNTLACTIPYALNAWKNGVTPRRFTIVLFHICILVFLLGHLLSTFVGTNTTVTLQPGESAAIDQAGISLRLLRIDRNMVELSGQRIPLASAALLEVSAPGGRQVKRLGAFRPAFARGTSLHIALRDKGGPEGAVQIIVRQDYGAIVLMCGACLAMLATVGYALVSWSALAFKPHGGTNS